VENNEKAKVFFEAGRRLRQARIALGFNTQTALAEWLGGFTLTRVSRAERGENPMPGEMLYALAAKGVNTNWILTGEGEMMAAEPPDERPRRATVLEGLRGPEKPYGVSRVVASGFREIAAEELPGDSPTAGVHVPIISAVAAGEALGTTAAEQHPAGFADAYVEYRGAPPRAFALRVVGDSMAPDFASGDLVIVDPDVQARGRAACVLYVGPGGERLGRLKILAEEAGGRCTLHSINPAYAPVELPCANLIAAWRIVAHLPRVAGGERL